MADVITDKPRPEPQAEQLEKGMPFYPDFALREALTALALLVALVVLASVTEPTLEPVADPGASGYVPRPEWYFLWLFQALKYFKAELEVLGTFVLPTAAMALIIALPFLDRRKPRTHRLLPRTRPIRIWGRVLAAAAMLGIGYLTVIAVAASSPMVEEGPELTAAQAAGLSLYDKMGCASCHVIAGEGGNRGPDLTTFGAGPDAENRVLLHFGDMGQAAESIMPGYQLSAEELRSLAAYLLSLRGG